MSGNQKSVTLAFVLVAAGLAVKHSWFRAAGTWAAAAPSQAVTAPAASRVGPLADWQAATVLYMGLMLVADTQLGAMAPPIAWAVGLIEAMAASKALPGAAGSGQASNGPQGQSGIPVGTLPQSGGSGPRQI